jgi:very-short-patch-repair endonuclease
MMPPDVQDIAAAADAAFEQDRKDAESYRLIGQAGWKLVRISDLQVLLDAVTNLTRVTSEFNARHQSDGA